MKNLLFILILIFTINSSHSFEKVVVPDYVDKKTKSPWNFYDDFEEEKLRFQYIKQSKNIWNSPGRKPYKFEKDQNGNTFLSITVKHKWNRCCGSNFYSERAEIFTRKKNAKNKEIWYGFKIRFPKDFKDINDRLLISQFMNEFKNMKKSPLMGIQLYWAGDKLVIGGDTGGRASVSWNSSDHYKFKVENTYLKKSNQWKTLGLKRRDNDEFKIWTCEISKNNTSSVLPDYCNTYKSIKFTSTPKGEWSTFKIGIRNSDKKNGFMKVFKDDELIMNYQGITFGGWKGSYKHTFIKIGPYRDTDPNGEGYPDQTIHYDDFIVVSDKKTLDGYLK